MDVSAFEMLIQEKQRIEAQGGALLFASFKGTVLDELRRAGLLKRIGEEHFFNGSQDAIRHWVPRLDQKICDQCSARIFHECPSQLN